MNATVMAVVNQKGGTGKTTTCENLGVGLAMEGKRVLLVDADPQANLTISLGWNDPDAIPATLPFSIIPLAYSNFQGLSCIYHLKGVTWF